MAECPICLNEKKISFSWPKCNHSFCEECIQELISSNNHTCCPLCRNPPNYYMSLKTIFYNIIYFIKVDFPIMWESFSDFMIEQKITL